MGPISWGIAARRWPGPYLCTACTRARRAPLGSCPCSLCASLPACSSTSWRKVWCRRFWRIPCRSGPRSFPLLLLLLWLLLLLLLLLLLPLLLLLLLLLLSSFVVLVVVVVVVVGAIVVLAVVVVA